MMKSFILQRLRESVDKPMKKKAAGVLIKCSETDRVFLMLRNDKVPKWSLMSGGLKPDEDPMEGLIREIGEELSIDASIIEFKKIRDEEREGEDTLFHYYEGLTSKQFIAKLDHENLEYGWFSEDKLPSPLFDGMKEKIADICSTQN